MGRFKANFPPRPCAYKDCDVIVKNRLGFCVQHHSVAWPCSFDTSCRNRCAAHSRTRLCQEHAWYGYKLRREKLAAQLDTEGEE